MKILEFIIHARGRLLVEYQRGLRVVADCIPSARAHTVHPANDAGEQQTSYLFGKENIHRAMI